MTHRYKRPEVTDWQEEIAGLMREQWTSNKPPYFGRVSVSIKFTTYNKRLWDMDNRLKALLDCLEKGGVIANDNQIDGLHVTRRRGTEDKTSITLMEYEGSGSDEKA